jgi:chromosomal replication initiator protein
MTFGAFCSVAGSRVAYDACLDFARRPDSATRLLVLDGPVGCGKTHLLHAIANDVRRRRPGAEILCLAATPLVDQLVYAIVSDSWPTFVDRLSHCHLIVIDDVFALSGREFATRAVGRALSQWVRAGVLVATASSSGAAQLAQLTEGVTEASRRHVIIRRPTERQIFGILERRAAAVAVRDSTLRRIARQSCGDVGRALGMLTTASVRRMAGRAAPHPYSPLPAAL